MKKYLMLALTLLVCTAPAHAARGNVLEKEMEDYARDFYRAHPDAAGDKKTREAREDLVKKAKSDQILELTKDQEKLLRKRDDVVTDGAFKTALNKLKALNSKDPEVTFLIKYSEKEKIKPAEKLLAHRLTEKIYEKAAAKAGEARGKQMFAVMAKYSEYKATNGKAPASLADLDLPDELKQFTNPATGEKSDWIYIGHLGPTLKTGDSHIVLAEPEPLGDARVCGLDNGNIVNFKDSAVKGHLEKLSKSAPNKGAGPTTAPAGKQVDHPGLANMKTLMKKIRIFKELYNGRLPATLAELDLTDDEKQYTDPDGGAKMDWIYYPKKSPFKTNTGEFFIVISPKAYKGNRMVGLSNDKVVSIPDGKIAPHLKK